MRNIWIEKSSAIIEEKIDCDDKAALQLDDVVELWKAVKIKVFKLKQLIASGEISFYAFSGIAISFPVVKFQLNLPSSLFLLF